MTGQGNSKGGKSWIMLLFIRGTILGSAPAGRNELSRDGLARFKFSKVREFSVDSRCESVTLRIPRKGGTGSISGVGVLLWPGKPILCGL